MNKCSMKKSKLLLVPAATIFTLAACSQLPAHYTSNAPPEYSRVSPAGVPITAPPTRTPVPSSGSPSAPTPTASIADIAEIPSEIKPEIPPSPLPTPVEHNHRLSQESAGTHSPMFTPSAPIMPTTPTTPTTPAPPATTPQASATAVLATFETQFKNAEKNRATNITRAAQSIHGTVVAPGEVFSYNDTVGPTNEKRGYKESIVFVEGEKEKGVGGGVCQVSTTLHGAAKAAGLTILERHDHSRPVEYADSGEEAATSYGGIDFKFVNDQPHPITIHCTTDNETIKATIIAQ